MPAKVTAVLPMIVHCVLDTAQLLLAKMTLSVPPTLLLCPPSILQRTAVADNVLPLVVATQANHQSR